MKYTVTIGARKFEVEVVDGPDGPRASLGGVTASLSRGILAKLERGGRAQVVALEPVPGDPTSWDVQLPGGRPIRCAVEDERARLGRLARGSAGGAAGPKTVLAVMPGIVVSVAVERGTRVAPRDALLVVEAMKMQNEIRAEAEGVVAKVHVKPGQSIAAGAPLIEIAPAPSPG